MLQNYRLYLGLVSFVALAVYGISFVPSLTSGGVEASTEVDPVVFQKAVRNQRAYCETLDADIDCKCYGDIAGLIALQDSPRVAGATYANQQDLGRAQAEDAC